MPNTMPKNVAKQLLDKLGSDDGFRQLFVEDPTAALKRLGYDLPSDQAACLQVKSLADKESIRKSRAELEQSLSDPPVFQHAALGSY